jgi:hypothetical protein
MLTSKPNEHIRIVPPNEPRTLVQRLARAVSPRREGTKLPLAADTIGSLALSSDTHGFANLFGGAEGPLTSFRRSGPARGWCGWSVES